MALVAGLNAGAAALHGQIVSPAQLPGEPGWRATEPTAAESARQAGVAAAELVVDGAGLHGDRRARPRMSRWPGGGSVLPG